MQSDNIATQDSLTAPEPRFQIDPLVKAWITALSGVVLLGVLTSLFRGAYLGAWLGAGWILVCLAWAARRRHAYISVFQFLPFGILLFLGLLSLCIGLHAFLDSLTYRIPQMQIMLQEGRPTWTPHVDSRINTMPYIWSFIMAPFYVTLGERALALPSWISFGIFWALLFSFARKYANAKKAPWIALIFLASPVFVYQSSSTDNSLFAATMILASLHFSLMVPFSLSTLIFSGLSLALACGAKPQFCLLGFPWVLWALRNYKNIPAKKRLHAFWIIPLFILLSPVPSMVLTLLSSSGSSNALSIIDGTPRTLVQRGLRSIMHFCIQFFALPANPWAEQGRNAIQCLFNKIGLTSFLGPIRFSIYPIPIPESASFGIFSSLALVTGFVVRKRSCRCTRFEISAALWGAGLLLIAFFMTGAKSVGRSFIGFIFLSFPLALSGLKRLNIKLLKCWAGIGLLSGSLLMFINPHRPLFPIQNVERRELSFLPSRMVQHLKTYQTFQQRIIAGESILQALPPGTEHIGAIVQEQTPLHRFWNNRINHKIYFFSTNISKETLNNQDIKHLIVHHEKLIHNGDNEIDPEFLERIQGKVSRSKQYTSLLRQGPICWFLIEL